MSFAIGTPVRLAAGTWTDPRMVVVGMDLDDLVCAWFDKDGQRRDSVFPPAALRESRLVSQWFNSREVVWELDEHGQMHHIIWADAPEKVDIPRYGDSSSIANEVRLFPPGDPLAFLSSMSSHARAEPE